MVYNDFNINLSSLSKTCNTVCFRMVFTIISVFSARQTTQCLVDNAFYTNFSSLSKTCDTEFGLESFLQYFQYFKQGV